MADIDRGERYDMTRWCANEALRSGGAASSSKGDVWSFGCLLWEVATLGATPYSGVRTRDVGVRVMRGLRLPQTGYMSDDLYQVYHCHC